MNRFEKLSLFTFKNCIIALFVGKLLAKLLMKMPLKHIIDFAGRFYSRNSHEILCLKFSVF